MRKVIYTEAVKKTHKDGRVYYQQEYKGEGVFHKFGVDYEEFESGAGTFSTAIIELKDGSIKNIYVENIKFINDEVN